VNNAKSNDLKKGGDDVEVTSSGRGKDLCKCIEEQIPLRFEIPF